MIKKILFHRYFILIVALFICVVNFFITSNVLEKRGKTTIDNDSTAVNVELVSERKLRKMVEDSLRNVIESRNEKITELTNIKAEVKKIYVSKIIPETTYVKTDSSGRFTFISPYDKKIKWLRFKGDVVTGLSVKENVVYDFSTSIQNVEITEDPVKFDIVLSQTVNGYEVARLDYDKDRFNNVTFAVTKLDNRKLFSLGFGLVTSINNEYKNVIYPSVYMRFKTSQLYVGKLTQFYLNYSMLIKKRYDLNIEYTNDRTIFRLIYVLR